MWLYIMHGLLCPRLRGKGGGASHQRGRAQRARVQRVQKVQKVQRVAVSPLRAMSMNAAYRRRAACGSENLHNRASPDGNAPLLPPAAVSPPEGEVCSTCALELT